MPHREIRVRAEGPANSAHLKVALIAYHQTLQVYIQEALPQQWTMTQHNLSIVPAALVGKR
jgi:hypothetical protein